MRWLGLSAHRELVLDWVFIIGVFFKAVDGLGELLFGIPALFVSKLQVTAIAHAVTAGELVEDPNDLIANVIVHESAKLTAGALLIGGAYLVIHGAVKVAIVGALLVGSRRVYPWAVGALTVLLVVQVVDLVVTFSVGVLLLTVLDVVIIWLTVREWRHGRTLGDVARLRMPWLGRIRLRRRPAAG